MGHYKVITKCDQKFKAKTMSEVELVLWSLEEDGIDDVKLYWFERKSNGCYQGSPISSYVLKNNRWAVKK